jgi:proline dehydrogenase
MKPPDDKIPEEMRNRILFSATLLSARKIIDALDSSKPNPGRDFFIERAVKEAAAILEKIDQRWPAEGVGGKVR